MECRQIQETLSAYIDGEISQEEKTQVDTHLLSCDGCTLALSELSASLNRVRELEEVDPPPWLTQKIMEQVQEKAEKKKGLYERFFPQFLVPRPIHALAAILILVLSVYVFQTMQTSVRLAKAPVEKKKEAPRDERVEFAPGESGKYRPEIPADTSSPPKDEVTPVTESVEQTEVASSLGTAGRIQSQEKVIMQNRQVPDEMSAMTRESGLDKAEAPMEESAMKRGAPVPEVKMKKAPAKVSPGKEGEINVDRYDRTYAETSPVEAEEDAVFPAGATVKRDVKPELRERNERLALQESVLTLVISVENPDTARVEIEKVLAELKSTAIVKEFFDDKKDIFHAVLKGENISKLKEKLSKIGTLKDKAEEPEGERPATETVLVRIELVSYPTNQ
jgi:hypothetical protein